MIHPRTPSHSLPRQKQRGFALIVTIVLVAFLVLILLGLATFTRVETQVATNSQSLSQARQNAVFALNIAVGQLQKYAGPDQRITAPATTVYPAKDVTKGTGDLYDNTTYGFRAKAVTSRLVANGTYLTPAERLIDADPAKPGFDGADSGWEQEIRKYWNGNNRQPHYTAVFNSSLRLDPTTTSQQFGEFKRDQIPVWLVSGVEKYQIDQSAGTVKDSTTGADRLAEYLNYYSPTPVPANLPDPDLTDPNNKSIWLVNTTSATDNRTSSDGLDGRVKVLKQEIKGPTVISTTNNQTIGHYAYWVGDESQKANFAVRDPYASATTGSVDYRNRLQVPQRLGWERMLGFFDQSSGVAYATPNDLNFLKVLTANQIPFVSTGNSTQLADAIPRNFHNLTAFSKSLQTDTALGGLKKDLTNFLSGTGASITASSPLLDRNLYNTNDPRFGSSNTGFPKSSGSTANLGTWQDVADWYNPSTSGNVQPGRAPVLAGHQMFFAFTYEAGKLQFHMVPCIVLWNPYDTALDNTSYNLKWRHNFGLWKMGIATNGLIDPTPADQTDGGTLNGSTYFVHTLTGLDWYSSGNSAFKKFAMGLSPTVPPISGVAPNQETTYFFSPFDTGGDQYSAPPASTDTTNATWVTYSFTSRFEPGQVKIFTVGSSKEISSPKTLHTGSTVIDLVNNFATDYPKSYYFDIATVGPPLPTAADFAARNVKIFAGLLLGTTADHMSMELRKGPSTVLWRSESLGSSGNWGGNLDFGYTPLQMFGKDASTWRGLYDRSTWNATAKNNATNASRNEPLIGMYNGSITPLTPWSVEQFQRGAMAQMSIYQRVFATYNLAAPSTDLDPNIEGLRAKDTANNTDRFALNKLYSIEYNAAYGWSSNGATPNNQFQVSGIDSEGFALMTWKSLETSTKRIKGLSRIPLRQASRAASEVLSLGQLQQVNLSKLAWQPSFPIGNSEATPYVDRARVAGIESYLVGRNNPGPGLIKRNDTQNRQLDVSYLLNENLWDRYFLSSVPQSGSFTTYDPATNSADSSVGPVPSVLLPNSRHKLTNIKSTTSADDIRSFDTASAYVSNVGALNVNSTSVEAWKALLTSFRGLSYDSDSENRSATVINQSIPVSRIIDPLKTSLGGGNLEFTETSKNDRDIGATEVGAGGRDYSKFFTGYRYLTDPMIQTLAERIVDEVRLRGPFYSLADFVNRRLVAPDGAYTTNSVWQNARTDNKVSGVEYIWVTHSYGVKSSFFSSPGVPNVSNYDSFLGLQGINGTLQRAINVSGINGGMNYPISPADKNDRSFRVQRDPSLMADGHTGDQPMSIFPNGGHYLDTEHLAGAPTGEVGQLLSHSPGFVTQGDLLAMLGPALTPRGDTFLIRTYGDAVNPATGELSGRAWLEAVVQRFAEPVTSADPANPTTLAHWQPVDAFGRKFKIVSFRWLNESEL